MIALAKPAAGGLLVVFAAASTFYFNRAESGAAMQSTDDAYVQADFTNVASRLAGVVETLSVEENQTVQQGDLLAVLDDRDQKIAVQNAEAAIAVSEAHIKTLQAQIARQEALVREAQAAIAADDAVLQLAQANDARARDLMGSGTVAKKVFDEAVSTLATAIASRASHLAGVEAARRQQDILDAQMEAAQAVRQQAHTALAEAELRLSYTLIKAPIAGTIGQKSLRTGAYVTVGTTLLSIVPLDRLYVRANFRETQLARVRPGQTVQITVDALPGQAFAGTVESLGPASGVSYSAIAPQNATGNFTKVVQRLPVRIGLAPGQPGLEALRVGMSVVSEIHIE